MAEESRKLWNNMKSWTLQACPSKEGSLLRWSGQQRHSMGCVVPRRCAPDGQLPQHWRLQAISNQHILQDRILSKVIWQIPAATESGNGM